VREIKALTSLRGIAAMMVVTQHFSATAQSHAAVTIPSFVPHGYMAVSLFFVLSGFIMAYTYHADFALRGVPAMPSFLLKRAARILPLNTAVVIAIVAAGMASEVLLGRNIFYDSANIVYDVLCNLLLLQGIGLGSNLNGPSWSISTEAVAYLLFPGFLAIALSRRTVIAISAAIISVGALFVMSLKLGRRDDRRRNVALLFAIRPGPSHLSGRPTGCCAKAPSGELARAAGRWMGCGLSVPAS
jgi:peptidoglycan/LPS O-acetylase OafA/YrhL